MNCALCFSESCPDSSYLMNMASEATLDTVLGKSIALNGSIQSTIIFGADIFLSYLRSCSNSEFCWQEATVLTVSMPEVNSVTGFVFVGAAFWHWLWVTIRQLCLCDQFILHKIPTGSSVRKPRVRLFFQFKKDLTQTESYSWFAEYLLVTRCRLLLICSC